MLLVPLRIQGTISGGDDLQIRVEVSWLFLRIRRERPGAHGPENTAPALTGEVSDAEPPWQRWWRWRSLAHASRPVRKAAAPVAVWLARRIQVAGLELRVRVGGADPVRTAMAYGGAWASLGTGLAVAQRYLILDPSRVKLEVEPAFDQRVLRVHAVGQVRIRPLWLLWGGIHFLLRGGLGALRQMRAQLAAPV